MTNKLDFNNYQHIIVYTMGRVGSMTMIRTIRIAIDKNNIEDCTSHHIHILNDYYRSMGEEEKELHKDIIKQNTIRSTNGKKILIITIVRNFYDQLISNFILRLASQKSLFYFINKHKLDYTKLESCISQLSDHFTQKAPLFLEQKGHDWYDRFRDEFNIDVYSRDFDFDKKYMIFETSEVDLCLFRFEEIQEWDNIFQSIFKQKVIVTNHDLTKNKPFANLSKKFKEYYQYSEELTNQINNSKVMKHFYTKTELEEFASRYKHKQNI